ncbi:MAG TPA: DUF3168 domain-containing protein [Beijerinckiaceae bacterium]|nr:DUF3168 domain-containing protein [Beijerinckiaceae bacterium]
MTHVTALQAALVALLKADAAVAAIVGAKVFDEIPEDQRGPTVKPPYLYVGPVNKTRIEMGAFPPFRVRLRLYAVSTEFGRREAWLLADAVESALEDARPALAAPYEVTEPVAVLQAGDVIEPLNPKSVFVDVQTTVVRA